MSEPSAPPPNRALVRRGEAIRSLALAYPEAFEEFPWGHSAFKVGKAKKVFLFLVVDAAGLRLSMKLPESAFEALLLPFCEPTGYGLGKSGWVTASFGSDENPPLAEIERWLDESFRAVAPKGLVRALDEAGEGAATSSAQRGSAEAQGETKSARKTAKATKKASKKAAGKAAKETAKKATQGTGTRKAAGPAKAPKARATRASRKSAGKQR